jgi:hypothetical protein
MKALILIGIIAIMLGACETVTRPLPNTREMHDYFATHQTSFEHVTQDIITALDKHGEIGDELKTGAHYKILTIISREPKIIRYHTHTKGFAMGMYGTGIVFFEVPPEKAYANIEDMYDDARAVEGFEGYSLIKGNWYTFLWEVD